MNLQKMQSTLSAHNLPAAGVQTMTIEDAEEIVFRERMNFSKGSNDNLRFADLSYITDEQKDEINYLLNTLKGTGDYIGGLYTIEGKVTPVTLVRINDYEGRGRRGTFALQRENTETATAVKPVVPTEDEDE